MKIIFVLLCFALAAFAAPQKRAVSSSGCFNGRVRMPNPFIVGGSEVNPRYKWPFIGSLRSSSRHFCGGSLVKSTTGNYYFITAAHCVDGANTRFLSVKFGAHYRVDTTADSNSFIDSVDRIIMHENYNRNTLENDIAVLILRSSIPESSYIQPICIASRTYTANEPATVIGWGTLSEGGSVPDQLQEVSKPIMTDAQCSSYIGSAYRSASMMCSGLVSGGVDACQGDSGGPLFSSRNGVWELVGVVSWGYGCARPNNPGVYADVYNLRNWINNQVV